MQSNANIISSTENILDTIIKQIRSSDTQDRTRINLSVCANPENSGRPECILFRQLIDETMKLSTSGNIQSIKSSNILPFAAEFGLIGLLKYIIKYYTPEEINDIRPEARKYDIFKIKYDGWHTGKNPNQIKKLLQNKEKSIITQFINLYLEALDNAITSRSAVLSLSMKKKTNTKVRSLLPENINTIMSYHKNPDKYAEVKPYLPDNLRIHIGGNRCGTRYKKNPRMNRLTKKLYKY